MRTTFTCETPGRGLHDVTEQVRQIVRGSGVTSGLCHVFLRHTSASLVIQENADPSAQRDLEAFFDRLAPDGDSRYTHTDEGPDDMPSHIRAALTRSSETLVVDGGDLVLGTWQGLFLFEHRRSPHRRQLDVMIVADRA